MTTAAEIATLTVDATRRALETSSVYPAVVAGAVLSSVESLGIFYSPDPRTLPGPEDTGWPVASAASAVTVRLHEDLRARTAYLVIPGEGPFTGDFTLTLTGGGPATYSATAETRDDVLAGWLAQILTVYGSGGTATLDDSACVVLPLLGTTDTAIRLRAVDPEDGTFGTFDILTGTTAPVDSSVVLLREAETVVMTGYARPSSDVTAAIDSAATAAIRANWAPLRNVPTDPIEGFFETWQTGGASAVWVRVASETYGGDTVALVAGRMIPTLSILVSVDPCTSQP